MGAADGFEDWAGHNWAQLLGIARIIAGEHATAEDVLQDALVDIYSRWSKVRGFENLMGYATTVMSSKMANRRRTAWARRVRVTEEMQAFEHPVPSGASSSDDYLDVVEALQGLNARQREVVAMHYLLDMPVAQIAQELGRPVGSITSDLTRGRKTLRETLSPRGSSG